jgi:hypothetical protein
MAYGEERVSYILSKEKTYEVILAVLKATKFANKYHDLRGTPEGDVLVAHGLDPFHIYVSIAPEIQFLVLGYPEGYNRFFVNLNEFPEGKDDCDHKLINLYWETGGGGAFMESGTGHRYTMCMHCGYNPNAKKKKPVVVNSDVLDIQPKGGNFFTKLFWLIRGKGQR